MRPRMFALPVLAFAASLFFIRVSTAEELWTVRSGVTAFYFNQDLLPDLHLELTDIQGGVPLPPEMEFRVAEPNWTFPITASSNLTFRVDREIALPYGVTGGSVVHTGSMSIRDLSSGISQTLAGMEIAYVPVDGGDPGETHPSDTLVLRDRMTREPVFELRNPMFDFRAQTHVFWIHYMNLTIAEGWARRFGRPDLAGLTIGQAEMMANAEWKEGTSSPGGRPQAVLTGTLDVKLGGLQSIQQVAHSGTYPTGTAALSMATTACNIGDSDVPWHAPMNENHPLIAMAL